MDVVELLVTVATLGAQMYAHARKILAGVKENEAAISLARAETAEVASAVKALDARAVELAGEVARTREVVDVHVRVIEARQRAIADMMAEGITQNRAALRDTGRPSEGSFIGPRREREEEK